MMSQPLALPARILAGNGEERVAQAEHVLEHLRKLASASTPAAENAGETQAVETASDHPTRRDRQMKRKETQTG
jgi:hypothetical protein